MSTVFVVLRMDKKLPINIVGTITDIDICWATGMIGAMAVFANKEDAEVFADGRFEIMTCTI